MCSYKQEKQFTLHVLNLICNESHPRFAHGHWQPAPVNLCTCAACASLAFQGCQQPQGLSLMSWSILSHLRHREVRKFQTRRVRLSV